MSIMLAAGASLAYSGFASISYTMDRHYADIHGRGSEPDERTRRRYQTLGWLSILLSFFACIIVLGWNIGPVLWCGMLTFSAIVLTLLLQYSPHKAIHLAKVSYVVALIAGMAWILQLSRGISPIT